MAEACDLLYHLNDTILHVHPFFVVKQPRFPVGIFHQIKFEKIALPWVSIIFSKSIIIRSNLKKRVKTEHPRQNVNHIFGRVFTARIDVLIFK